MLNSIEPTRPLGTFATAFEGVKGPKAAKLRQRPAVNINNIQGATMPRPSDRAIKRQAELDRQTQQAAPTRLDSITIGAEKTRGPKPGGIRNNLKTIDLRRTGRRS